MYNNLTFTVEKTLKEKLPVIIDRQDLKDILKISDRTISRIFAILKKKGKLIKIQYEKLQISRADFLELLDDLQEIKLQ